MATSTALKVTRRIYILDLAEFTFAIDHYIEQHASDLSSELHSCAPVILDAAISSALIGDFEDVFKRPNFLKISTPLLEEFIIYLSDRIRYELLFKHDIDFTPKDNRVVGFSVDHTDCFTINVLDRHNQPVMERLKHLDDNGNLFYDILDQINET